MRAGHRGLHFEPWGPELLETLPSDDRIEPREQDGLDVGEGLG